MPARTSTIDPEILARNLLQLADEKESRLRRIAIRSRRNKLGWFDSWFQFRPPRADVRYWWLAPASWAVVFSIGFFVTDWFWDAFGQFLGRLGL